MLYFQFDIVDKKPEYHALTSAALDHMRASAVGSSTPCKRRLDAAVLLVVPRSLSRSSH